MGNVVVDSSVVIKWFVAEPYSNESRRLLNDYSTGKVDFIEPDLLYAEVGNIVWRKHVLQGLNAVDAQQILHAFGKLSLRVVSASTLLADAYQMAVTHQRTVYDSLYLALAVRENCPFVTADEKLVNAVSSQISNVLWIANWP
jgi:predicted nucleic acid-binding protein